MAFLGGIGFKKWEDVLSHILDNIRGKPRVIHVRNFLRFDQFVALQTKRKHGLFYRCIYPKGHYSGLAISRHNRTGLYSGQMAKTSYGKILCVECIQWLLYCNVLYLYIYTALLAMHTNQKRFQRQKTQREKSSLEITKRGTWLTS